MRAYQSGVAALALAAVLPLAGAADAATPTAGSATSTATLATLSAVGHQVALATVSATADNISGALAKVSVAPLKLDGADVVPAVTVEPATSPVTVPSVSTPAEIAPIVSVASPALSLTASSDAAGQASGLSTPSGLGALSILGLDLSIDGTLSVGSLVNATKADAGKTLEIADLALPSVADILRALGLDIAKLPADTLQSLISELGLVLSEAQAAVNGAVDDAQAAMGGLPAEIAALEAGLPALQAAADTAATTAAGSLAAFNTALAATPAAALLYPGLAEFTAAGATAATAFPALATLANTANADSAAAAAAAAAVTQANAAIDALQDQVNAALAAISGLVEQLADVVAGVLSDTPLVSLGSASVGTIARVDASKTAQVIGSVSGLEVIGTDVLDLATGSSTIDVAKTASDVIAQVNGEIAGVLGTLSSVLEGVAGVTFPAPTVALLQKTTATGVDGAFGTANVTVSVLDIAIPGIQLPENVVLDTVLNALPADLMDNLSLVDGLLEATGFELQVGTIAEAARFRGAALTPVPGNRPVPGSLPATGAPYGLALLAAAGVAGAVMLRRSAARSEA